MRKTVSALCSILVLLMSGCVKDAGTGSSNITFQLKAAVSAVNGASIVWSAGTAGVVSTRIEAKKNDSSAVEFKSAPYAVVDLFGTASVTNVSIPTGTYRSVQFKTELQPINNKPALYLDGNYTAGGVTTPIYFEVGTAVTVKGEKSVIEIPAANGNYTVQTTIGLLTLTADVTEADLKAAIRINGKIPISASNNTAVYNKMLANLAKTQECTFK